jgi:hypothetical protein
VPRGLRRLRALFENWVTWPEHAQLRGGCPIHAASAEYDDQPGPMRDAVVDRQRLVARELAKAVRMAVDSGELRGDTDASQFVFEMFGLILAYYHTQRVLGDSSALARARTGFDRLVEAHRAAPPAPSPASRPAARGR